ncbi:MAG: ATP-binding protein [Candidatus Peribacteraceae bacterium]
MNHNGHRVIAEGEWVIGALPPELDQGFERIPYSRGGKTPMILNEMGSVVREQIMVFLRTYLQLNGDEFPMKLAMEEIIMNVIHHGNEQIPYLEGRIVCSIIRDVRGALWLVLEVYDQGKVFDLDAVPECTDTENLEATTGRGLKLIRSLGGFHIEPPVSLDGRGKLVRFTRPIVEKDEGVLELAPVPKDEGECPAE